VSRFSAELLSYHVSNYRYCWGLCIARYEYCRHFIDYSDAAIIYLISTYFQMILYRHPEEEVQRSRIQFGRTEKNGGGNFAWSQCKNDEATH